MVQIDRSGRWPSGMPTAARPSCRQRRASCQAFGGTIVVRQVPVDPPGCRVDAAGKHVPGHERDGMSFGVLPACEAIYPVDYVEPAERRVVSRDTLAFDNGMRAVVPVSLPDFSQVDGDIGKSRGRHGTTVMGLGTGKDRYPLVRRNHSVIHCGLHARQEALG